MTNDQYILLYEKYKQGLCTPEEQKLLMDYADEINLSGTPWDESILGDQEKIKAEIYGKLQKQLSPRGKVKVLWITRWAAAAILLLSLSFGVYTLVSHPKKAPVLVKNSRVNIKNDILPGGNKAILRLANGSVIVLNNVKNGIIARQGNVNIQKTGNGQLIYAVNDHNANNSPDNINTVSTPRGGQYELILPDGSKVWLNAASSLSFPTEFTGAERNVKLTGEAYFEVAKNKSKPFKISVNNMKVEVLGTHFNIMAYDDEANIKTTLMEGAVKIADGASQTLLKPGQQAVLNKINNHINVNYVNTGDAIAWKNGHFVFNHEDIQEVMRKVSRWYDVDIEYGSEIPDDHFEGSINRSVNVSKVIDMLELTGQVHFKIQGRRITVTR